jgi:hypothetical protein
MAIKLSQHVANAVVDSSSSAGPLRGNRVLAIAPSEPQIRFSEVSGEPVVSEVGEEPQLILQISDAWLISLFVIWMDGTGGDRSKKTLLQRRSGFR